MYFGGEKMIGLNKEEVKLYPHSADWAEEYEKEKVILQKILGDDIIEIHHVGSTSIPGLMAKPIIDIAVGVKDEQTQIKLIPILASYGYDMKDSIKEKGEVLARKGPPELRTHYIHIEIINTPKWEEHILFKDYLIKHPEYVQKYQNLKQKLAQECNLNRKLYTSQKDEFIKDVLKKAKEERA